MKYGHAPGTILLLVISCLGVREASAQNDPKIMDLQFFNPMVSIGQSIELKCIVENVDKQHALYFYKQGVDPASGQTKWFQLAKDDKAQYNLLPYSFWINEKGDIDEYMLRVESAEVTMSGNYSCAIIKTSSGAVLANTTTELKVIVEPTSLKIYIDGVEIEPNSTKLYSFSSVHTLQCVANGSNPAAKIDMWHGNQDLTRRATNLTIGGPYFSSPPSPQFPFLVSSTHSTSLTIVNWRIDVTYQTAPVTCLARASARSPGKAVKFSPIIEDGPPHFICDDTYIIPEAGNEDDGFEFTCRVLAKPALTGATFGCEPSSNCNPFSAFPVLEWHPASDTVYSGFLRNTDLNFPGSKDIIQGNMTLKIKIKKEILVGRSYSFTAENARGQAFHKVTVVGSADWLAASLTLSLLMSLVSKFLI